jgi:hypothetical protein
MRQLLLEERNWDHTYDWNDGHGYHNELPDISPAQPPLFD